MPVMRERLQGPRRIACMLRGLGVNSSADQGCCREERKYSHVFVSDAAMMREVVCVFCRSHYNTRFARGEEDRL